MRVLPLRILTALMYLTSHLSAQDSLVSKQDGPWEQSRFSALIPKAIDVLPDTSRYTITLGTLRADKDYKFELLLRNMRSTSITPQKLTVACGCMAGYIENATIPPTRSGTLRVMLSSPNKDATLSKHIHVALKEQPSQDIQILLTAEFLAPLAFTESIRVSSTANGTMQRVKFSLNSRFPDISLRTVKLRPLVGFLQDIKAESITDGSILYSAVVDIPNEHIGSTAVEQFAIQHGANSAHVILMSLTVALPERIQIRPRKIYLAKDDNMYSGKLMIFGNLETRDIFTANNITGKLVAPDGRSHHATIRVDMRTKRLITATLTVSEDRHVDIAHGGYTLHVQDSDGLIGSADLAINN